MSTGIVDGLEEVNVDYYQGHGSPVSRSLVEEGAEDLLEMPSVGKSGKFVGLGNMGQVPECSLQLFREHERFTVQASRQIVRRFALELVYVLQASQQADYRSGNQYMGSDNDQPCQAHRH